MGVEAHRRKPSATSAVTKEECIAPFIAVAATGVKSECVSAVPQQSFSSHCRRLTSRRSSLISQYPGRSGSDAMTTTPTRQMLRPACSTHQLML